MASYPYAEEIAFFPISYANLLHCAHLLGIDFALDSAPFDEEAFHLSSEGAPYFSKLHVATSLLAPSTFPSPYPY